MLKNKKLKQKLIRMLREINRKKIVNFAGLGIVLYDSEEFPLQHCASLRLSVNPPKNIDLNQPREAAQFFSQTSKNCHNLHDGYHLFNKEGKLTHVAQYFWPPIVKNIKPNESYGTRHLSAKYGSCLRGVIAIGIINRDRKIFYFINGKSYNI